MADVARIAGVSVATVSRALAGSSLVTAETRARVQEAVSDTGYVVNHVAAGLRLQRLKQILVLLPTIANPFFAEIVLGIEEEAQSHGFSVLVGNTAGSPKREAVLARQIRAGSAAGLILLTGRRLDLPDMDRRVVAVSEPLRARGVVTVAIDHRQAAREATEHLLALGHRRVAHVAGPAGNVLTRMRIEGFRAALSAAGLAPGAAPMTAGGFTFESGGAAMRRLLATGARPTGVFCSNDEMAIGAINAAKAAGLTVPRDLSVIGFDDIPFAAAYDPPLTTIRQPRHALGRTAVAQLVALLAGEALPRRATLLPHELVRRATTSSPAS